MGSSRDPALPGPLGQQLIYMITLHLGSIIFMKILDNKPTRG
jgi:hypothetical protein